MSLNNAEASSSKHKERKSKSKSKEHKHKSKSKERKSSKKVGASVEGPFEHRVQRMRLSVPPKYAGNWLDGVRETLDGMLMR